MPSTKKPASGKRASLPRSADYAKSFLKHWERLSRSGRFDMRQLRAVMLLLIANDEALSPEWLDHPLKGEWADHREVYWRRFPADLSDRGKQHQFRPRRQSRRTVRMNAVHKTASGASLTRL